MKILKTKIISRTIGIGFIVISLMITFFSFQKSTQQVCVFPAGSTIAFVEVGGLDQDQARNKLKLVYENPIQIQMGNLSFNFSNEQLGFIIHYDEMVSALDCGHDNGFSNFWSFIWNKSKNEVTSIDLQFSLNDEVLNSTINEQVKPYVTLEPSPFKPIPDTTRFDSGLSGLSFDQDELVNRIKQEITSNNKKPILLELTPIPALSPTIEQITEQVRLILRNEDFSGVIEIYAERMSDHQKIQILNWYGEEKEPGVAFTAASTMKIPIMLSTFFREVIPLSEMMQGWIESMIVYSENDPADRLMEQIDVNRGPLVVTEDIQTLGLQNSFIAGYFYLGAPLLNLYETPANQRGDAFIDPDVYNQTTPEDIGNLLSMIYDCSIDSTSTLVSETQGQITQEECSFIVETMAANKMGALIEAGLPEGLKIAHKHGWSQEKDGLVHSFSDVGIVYGPEEDFVLSVFTYSPNQLLFDIANPLIARISQTIYNGFNPNHQIAWPFPE